jgi:probable HAF family extracellular repeat protein
MSYKRTRTQGSGISLRLVASLCATVALGIAACTSDETTTEPTGPDLALTTEGSYRAIDLGTLPGGRGSTANGINALNQIVGESQTTVRGRLENHAVLWSNGVARDLGTFGGRWSRAFGINRAGKVVGGAATLAGNTRAFLWSNGTLRSLGTLGGDLSEARAINDAGQVVGSSTITPGSVDVRHAFLWENGVMKDLGTLGGNFSEALAINPVGQVVGESKTADGRTHAFLWSNGSMTDLGPSGGRSQAFGINRGGRIVGASAIGPRATVWVNGVRRYWGPLGKVSAAFGVNAVGLVVGVVQESGANQAVLWTKGQMTVLRGIDGNLIHGAAAAINADGEIVGASTDPGGDSHATHWTLQ